MIGKFRAIISKAEKETDENRSSGCEARRARTTKRKVHANHFSFECNICGSAESISSGHWCDSPPETIKEVIACQGGARTTKRKVRASHFSLECNIYGSDEGISSGHWCDSSSETIAELIACQEG